MANTLLNLSTITEPFDLATALVYMKENGNPDWTDPAVSSD